MAAPALATDRMMSRMAAVPKPRLKEEALAFHQLGPECLIALTRDALIHREWDREMRVWVDTEGGEVFDEGATLGQKARAYQNAVMAETIYITDMEINGEEGELLYLQAREERIRDARMKALRGLMGPVADEMETKCPF